MSEMNPYYISPNFTADKATPGKFLDWVDIWEDRMKGWLLGPARKLSDQGLDSHMAALQLAVGFLEPYEVFRKGEDSEGQSRVFFCNAFRRIFNKAVPAQPAQVWDHVTGEFYRQVRCGLFHSAMPGNKVYLTNSINGMEIRFDSNGEVLQILLNPLYFLDVVEGELAQYVATLRDSNHPDHDDLRAAFEKAWHMVHRR